MSDITSDPVDEQIIRAYFWDIKNRIVQFEGEPTVNWLVRDLINSLHGNPPDPEEFNRILALVKEGKGDDISSDPVDEIEFTDYDKVGGPKRYRRRRDISSDPVRAVVDAATAWSKSNPPDRARLDFVLRGKVADLEAAERGNQQTGADGGLSSDQRTKVERRDSAGVATVRPERDISSDPVCPECSMERLLGRHRWATDACSLSRQERDISSVTGSAAEAFVADTDDYGKWAYMERPEIEARVAAIQREAVTDVLLDLERYTGLAGSNITGVRHRIRALLEGKTDE